ncbi:hypothetical protein F5B19DRAFT_498927 [Rostrohypoxylon terebratum]|nr:hypothetical protein F5B19DRAFT_498927 [Rostrohypoxylon terebratum]
MSLAIIAKAKDISLRNENNIGAVVLGSLLVINEESEEETSNVSTQTEEVAEIGTVNADYEETYNVPDMRNAFHTTSTIPWLPPEYDEVVEDSPPAPDGYGPWAIHLPNDDSQEYAPTIPNTDPWENLPETWTPSITLQQDNEEVTFSEGTLGTIRVTYSDGITEQHHDVWPGDNTRYLEVVREDTPMVIWLMERINEPYDHNPWVNHERVFALKQQKRLIRRLIKYYRPYGVHAKFVHKATEDGTECTTDGNTKDFTQPVARYAASLASNEWIWTWSSKSSSKSKESGMDI